MEFHEKLQELRKQKGLTQEELARFLYVPVRRYPNGNPEEAIPASIL